MNTSNIDNIVGNLNPICINVRTKSSFNTLITLKQETDIESSISINNETGYEIYISEDI